MSTKKPISIGKILDRVGNSGAARLTERGQRLARLEHYLNQHLPPELIGRVQVGNFRDNQLILFVESPSWAARLRFQVPQLLQKLRQQGQIQPERIQIRVLPGRAAPEPPPRTARMSSEAADSLAATARAIDDPRLAAALERLAQRGMRSPDKK